MATDGRRSSRISLRSKQLGTLLVEAGEVQAEQIAEALKTQEQQGGLLGQILQSTGACTGQAIAASLLKQIQITDVQCDDMHPEPEVLQLVPRETCEASRLCPFERLGNLLCIVMGNPLDRKSISQIEESTKLKVKSFRASWVKISELIQRAYSADLTAAPAEGDGGLVMDAEAPPLEIGGMDSGGIMELAPPEIDVPAPAPVAPRQMQPAAKQRQAPAPKPPPQPEAPKIKGFENLDDSNAEMIETNKRGLSNRMQRQVPESTQKPKADKKAKINVDLDDLNLEEGEVVGEEMADEHLEELSPVAHTAVATAPAVKGPRVGDPKTSAEFIKLKTVQDAYFYSGAAPGGARSSDLQQLIKTIPVAEVVAISAKEYDARQKPKTQEKEKEKPVMVAGLTPLQLQPAPTQVMTPILISETEFQKFVSSLGEDPVGEWDWCYAASGPVPALVDEEAN